MKGKIEFSNREKGMIAIVAGTCVIALLMSFIVLQTALDKNATDKSERETERIVNENHKQPEGSVKKMTLADVEVSDLKARADGENIRVENNDIITAEKAKEIALADAGLKESQVTFRRIKYEWDNGIQIYDVEFYSGNLEYEYEMEAQSGRIFKKNVDD